MALDFYIQVETPAGVIVGPGPIITANNWTHTGRMDRAGEFSFSMPASDPMAAYVTEKRRVRAFALENNTWSEAGDGIIDRIETNIDDATMLTISGPDGAGELAGFVATGVTMSHSNTGLPQPVSYVIDLLSVFSSSYAGVIWTMNRTDITTAELYGAFYDESILGALIIVAEKSGGHFYYAGNRTINFFTTFTPSGVRAIDAQGELAPETCAIVSLKKTVETHELVTRIFPRGAGNGRARLALNACTRTAPTGYTLNKTFGTLRKDDAYSAYGTIDRFVEFKDITPISNTDADLAYAADALFDVAKVYLDVFSVRATSYNLAVAGCSVRLRPGQTIRVDYYDPGSSITIAEDLYIIEATIKIDEDGLQTTDLIVSTQARWPLTDGEVLASQIAEGRVFRANPQTGPNAYAVAYTKNVDDTETASFAFGFGAEVVQLQSVVFDFQLLPFESTVKSVGGSSTSTGSGGGTTVASASGGSTTSSSSGSHTHDVTVPSHTHTVADHTHSTTVAGHTHTVVDHTHTVSNHSHTVADHTHSTTVSNHTHTVGNHDHDVPDHQHSIQIADGSLAPSVLHVYSGGGSTAGFETTGFGTTVYAFTDSDSGATTTDSGGGTTSSAGGGFTQTSSDGGAQTSSAGGAQTSSSGGAQTSSAGGSFTQSSSAGGAQTSSSAASTTSTSASGGTHDHTVSSHTHDVTVSAHTHDVTASVSAVYGIFRESSLNTYAITDLEYRVNSGSWANLSGATSLGGGWYRLNITALVYSTTTFRPLQERNSLQIRRKAVAVASKTVTVDAQLFIRQTIQAIAYA